MLSAVHVEMRDLVGGSGIGDFSKAASVLLAENASFYRYRVDVLAQNAPRSFRISGYQTKLYRGDLLSCREESFAGNHPYIDPLALRPSGVREDLALVSAFDLLALVYTIEHSIRAPIYQFWTYGRIYRPARHSALCAWVA